MDELPSEPPLWLPLTLAATVALFLVSGLFAATEAAFLAASSLRAQQLAESGSPLGARLVRLLPRRTQLIAAALVVITGTNYVIEALATYFTRHTWGPHAEWFTLLVVTVLLLIFAEITPVVIATRDPLHTSGQVARLATGASLVLWPVTFLFGRVADGLCRMVGVRPAPPKAVTGEDISAMISVSERQGFIEQEEGRMLRAVLRFADYEAQEVMVPRPDVIAAEANLPVKTVADMMVADRLSRVPVYEGTIDRVAGVAHSKDLLVALAAGETERQVKELLRPAAFVPDGANMQAVLAFMQREHRHLAVVVDEFGGTKGIITLDDVLEQIVGEILDEYDVEEAEVQEIAERTFLVDGSLPIRDLNQRLGLDLAEEEGYSTVAGLMLALTGKLPQAGNEAVAQGARLVVESVEGRRVRRVRVVLPEPREEGEEG